MKGENSMQCPKCGSPDDVKIVEDTITIKEDMDVVRNVKDKSSISSIDLYTISVYKQLWLEMMKKYPVLDNKEWLTQKYVEEKLSAIGIAKMVGCCGATIYKNLRKHNIHIRTFSELSPKGENNPNYGHFRHPELTNKEWLYEKYWIENLPFSGIAEIIGCHLETVRRAIKRYNIPEKKTDLRLKDANWLHKKYHKEKLGCPEIAKIIGCNAETVRRYISKHHIPLRTAGETIKFKPSKYYQRVRNRKLFKDYRLNDREWLYQKYWIEKQSPVEIADEIGCSRYIVRIALKKAEIPIRTVSEEAKIRRRRNFICPELLDDPIWLKQKYTNEELSLEEIGKIIGCTLTTVRGSLIFYSVPIRNHKRSNRTREKNRIISIRSLRFTKKSYTAPERKFEEICKKYSFPFKYVGNGNFWIGNLNPDFIEANGKKICVEVFGDYWHSPLLRRNMRYSHTYEGRKEILNQHHWKLIVIWESDLKREDAEQFVSIKLKNEGVVA